jgi:hypothetical protein
MWPKATNKVAILLLVATYMITNAFIVAGVVRHWNDAINTVELQIEVQESSR